ncbi:hypothetical protein Nmel_011352 [Mimus melanotis]
MARIQMNSAQAGGQRYRRAATHPRCHSAPRPRSRWCFWEGVICLPWGWGFWVWRELRCWGFLFTRAAVPAVGGRSGLEGGRRWPEHHRCQNIARALSGSGVQGLRAEPRPAKGFL